MTASRILPEIRRLLSEQLEGTRRLNDLLEEEHAALARLESATVEKLAAEKQHELEALEIRERERLRLLAAAGYAPDQAGMTAFLHGHDPHGELTRQWEALLEEVRRCRQANRRNGGILELSRVRIQQALEILRGQLPAAGGYGPKGKSIGYPSRRTIAKA